MQLNKIVILPWDSSFFGYPTAQIVFEQSVNDQLDGIFQEIYERRIRLTYIFALPSDKELNKHLIEKGCVLVDQKIIYSKSSESHQKFENKILEFSGKTPNQRLLELGIQAGLYSRFKIDNNFCNNEFKRLYTQWIINSINKTLAFKTLVALDDSEIVGFITLSEKDQNAEIGLIAVAERFQGRGIGHDLINSADNISANMGYSRIRVATQLQNANACRLYEKCNFQIEKITNVYHYWQKVL